MTTDYQIHLLITVSWTVFFLLLISILFITLWSNRQQRKLQREHETRLLETKILAQEDLYNFLSGELHDYTNSRLGVIRRDVEVLFKPILNEPDVRDGWKTIQKEFALAGSSLRKISHSLNGDYISRHRLEENLRQQISIFDLDESLNCTIQFIGEPVELHGSHTLAVTRIVQETFHNIQKHANAKDLLLEVHYSPDRIVVSIEDNGKGFDLQELKKTDGLGMINIQSRVALLNGELEINSELGKGTKVKVKIPVR